MPRRRDTAEINGVEDGELATIGELKGVKDCFIFRFGVDTKHNLPR